MSELLELKSLAAGHSVMYVEDNEPLRLNAVKLLSKFFSDLRSAKDGVEALELLSQRGVDILITDIKMPRMDGLRLIKELKELKEFAPKSRAIIMSAFDEKPMLLQAIENGVFAYLKKPVNVAELTQTLQKALLEIKKEQESELFFAHLHTIFNYQSSMVIMLQEEKIVVANEIFLAFFGFKKMKDLDLDLGMLGERFLAHDGFLYNGYGVDVCDMLLNTSHRLFHVKMQDANHKMHHFIVKYNPIESKKGYGILSFDDVTELNLLGLFDAKKAQEDSKEEQNRYAVKRGDVFFTRTSETREEIGVSAVCIDDVKDTVFSGFVLRARPTTYRFNVEFCQYCFSSSLIRRQIEKTASITTRALTNGRLLSEVKIPLPPTLSEQEAIATILSDLDAEIAQLEAQLAKYRQLKQGMMQELLTGKTRLV